MKLICKKISFLLFLLINCLIFCENEVPAFQQVFNCDDNQGCEKSNFYSNFSLIESTNNLFNGVSEESLNLKRPEIYFYEQEQKLSYFNNELKLAENNFDLAKKDLEEKIRSKSQMPKENISNALEIFNEAKQKLKDIKKELDNFEIEFNNFKKILRDYYDNDYENNLKKICQKAKEYFADLSVTSNAAIVFDIDDTALLTLNLGKISLEESKYSFLAPEGSKEMFIKKFKGAALNPVLDLYNFLINKNYKIIFISSRSENSHVFTELQIKSAGYQKFEKIVLLQEKFREDWKYDIQKNLSKNKEYNIVGCIGDRNNDCNKDYSGYFVKLPNYLYN